MVMMMMEMVATVSTTLSCPPVICSSSSKLTFKSCNNKLNFQCPQSSLHFCSYNKPKKHFLVWASKHQRDVNGPNLAPQQDDTQRKLLKGTDGNTSEIDLGWLPAFPHVLTASMANFLFGYHIGVMNGPIVSVARELGFEGSSILEGLVVSIFIVGAFIGSFVSGSLVDKFGCRRTLQIDTIPLIIGAILSAQAHSVDEVLWGRFLVGLGIGVNTVLVPIYISEVAPTKYRGSLGSLCQIGTCLGIIASLLIGIPAENDPHWWRTMLYIASIPGFILTVGMQFAVDSPRWLCKMGRLNDAKTVVRNLWGPTEIDKAMEEFQSVFSTEVDTDSKWSELFQEPNYRVTLIGGGLFLLQQFAGINGVLYFSSLTFQDVGISNAALASLYVGLTNFAGALSALYLIDKQGRRKLLTGSYLGMMLVGLYRLYEGKCRKESWIYGIAFVSYHAISLFIIGCVAASMCLIAYAVALPSDKDLGHNLSIIGTLSYIYSFAIGAGPVTGIIIPELSSSRTRGKIMSFSFSVHWVCNFMVGLFFLELVRTFGIAPIYLSFGGVSLFAAAFCYFFIVETKGRSLEEIEMSLRSEPPDGET